MKKLLIFLFSILFLSSPSVFADDISDFQIEGMSIGDSLLDHFSEEEINNRKIFNYLNKDFASFYVFENLTTYEKIELNFKKNDNNFIIYALAGVIDYNNQVDKCLKKKKIIVNELEELLKKKPEHYEHIYKNDSLAHGTEFKFNSINKAFINDFIYDDGSHIRIWCSSWGDDLKKAFKWSDELRIKIESKVWAKWLENKSETVSPN